MLVVCAAIAAVACGEKKFYTVTYDYNGNGQPAVTRTVAAGDVAPEIDDPEWKGYDFKGWSLNGTRYDFSTPVKKDITLKAIWEQSTVVQKVTISWRVGDAYTFIYIVDGKESALAPETAEIGDTISFKVKIGTFYTGTPKVYADDVVLEADGKDVYSFTVPEDAEGTILIKVEGLKIDASPIKGKGTKKSPYLIETPQQFYAFATAVNNPSNNTYNAAYVELASDIDMGGEQLKPIGADLSATYFSGTFDGKGKTISNFTLNTESGAIGLFGYVAQASISNLNVEATHTLYLAEERANYLIGGVVAYNIASDIVNCTFNGDITVELPWKPDLEESTHLAFLGGIVGFAQGYRAGYSSYSATVSYCTVEGKLAAKRNPLYAIGGIAGSIVGPADSAPVIINNCVFSGVVDFFPGAEIAGGIVGNMREYTAVANCYSEGTVEASWSSNTAVAGPLVGFAENETAITFSYSTAECEMGEVTGNDNILFGKVVGAYYKNGIETEFLPIDGRQVLVHHAYAADENGKIGTDVDVTDFGAVKSFLGWSDADWDWDETHSRPVAKFAGEDGIEFNVVFDFSGKQITGETDEGEQTFTQDTVTITKNYVPINWVYEGSGMNTLVSDDDWVSYGYFLDEELTQRIPSAMLLTQNMTVYVGFANYGKVAGEYYIMLEREDGYVQPITLTLTNMGMATSVTGGRVRNDMFVYDGERILIRNSLYLNLAYNLSISSGQSYPLDLYGTVGEDGSITLFDNYYFITSDDSAILASPKNAVMGEWYTPDNETFTFYAHGYGTSSKYKQFHYELDGDNVTITLLIDGREQEVRVKLDSDGAAMRGESGALVLSLERSDEFYGKWEGEYGLNISVEFDGHGTATYNGEEHTYTVADGVATLDGGITASFNKDGLLVISGDGSEKVFGREGSFIGTWVDTSYDYTIVLTGIGRDGYGYATDSNGFTTTYVAQKNVDGYSLNFYYGFGLFGFGDGFTVEDAAGVEDGITMFYLAMYEPSLDMLLDDFNMTFVDQFYGLWNAEDETSLEFNGLGGYDIEDNFAGMPWVVQGKVDYTSASGETQTVGYAFSRKEGTATFEVNGVVYTAVRGEDGSLSVTPATGSAVTYLAPDDYFGADFQSEDGTVLHFNGKSNVGHGKMTMTPLAGEAKEYSYTVEERVATITDDDKTYTATLNTETGMLDVEEQGGSTVSYGLYSVFYGKTYVGKFDNGTITFKLNGVTSLIGYGTAVFKTDAEDSDEDSTIEVVQYGENVIVIYVGVSPYLYIVAQDENTVAVLDEYEELLFTLAVEDGWAGTYTSAEDDTLVLDGMGLDSVFHGKAVHTVDGESVVYTYEVVGDILQIGEGKVVEGKVVITVLYTLSKTASTGAVAYTNESGETFYLAKA